VNKCLICKEWCGEEAVKVGNWVFCLECFAKIEKLFQFLLGRSINHEAGR
jgi:hypothetical protein